ncbi:MAG TPA: hypothetical protein VNC82_19825 [Candidatus Limnocylindria bacterium]|nr:hypothetical protein [Candidatus Limnocylindria bacterium]
MTRVATMTAAIVMASTVASSIGIAFAQDRSHPLRPTAPGIERLAKGTGVIEGKLTRVDGRSESVDVSVGPFGLLGKTIEVGRDTLIQVNGREAKFADLQEGAKVKVFYEERGAKLVATRLEVSTGA